MDAIVLAVFVEMCYTAAQICEVACGAIVGVVAIVVIFIIVVFVEKK